MILPLPNLSIKFQLIRRELECPVCITVKQGQIYNCKNGHIVCQKCHGKLSLPKKCPSCQERMPHTTERNLALERIIDRLELGILSCTNEGCDHEGPKPEMDAHAAKCEYRSGQGKHKKAKKANKEELGPPGLSIILLIMAARIALDEEEEEDEMLKMKAWIFIGFCTSSLLFLVAIYPG